MDNSTTICWNVQRTVLWIKQNNMYIRSRHVRHVKDSGEGKYHMTHMSVLRSYISNHMFFVTVRAFPARSKSCELSGQTWCRRWPAPLRDFSPWQQTFGETKSRDDMRGKTREEEETEQPDVSYVGVIVDLLSLSFNPAAHLPFCHSYTSGPPSFFSDCCSHFSFASLCTQANIPLSARTNNSVI